MRFICLFVLALALPSTGFAAPDPANHINPVLLKHTWNARWVFHPHSTGSGYGVYHFRRSFNLETVPESFIVHVSADNRYRLFVNGQSVAYGPARGDLLNWRYETIDLAPYLRAGENVLASVVWNFGELRPLAQFSYRTAFLMQGNSPREEIVNTGTGDWRVVENKAYTGIEQLLRTFYVCGPGDDVDGRQYPWGWQQLSFDDTGWLRPERIWNPAVPRGVYNYAGTSGWKLVPRSVPMMEELPQRFAHIRRSEGLEVPAGFLSGKAPLRVPANTTATILFDQEDLTIGYPELRVSGGSDSVIRMSFAEALFDQEGRKGHRDVIEGKHLFGYYDLYRPDGGPNRLFRPLWYRTFRYVELEIQTGSEPLVLEDFSSVFWAYPFELQATFDPGDPMLEQIWDAGWRTARLCATETYADCPYYEQLQYIGDTRIQALISLYLAGDDRLMRNALIQFDDSRIPDGLTGSRYPSYFSQMHPTYSLIWILMIHDYHMLRPDTEFSRRFLMGMENVLTWFELKMDASGLLGRLEWPCYMDAAPGFGPAGSPPNAEEGLSAQITLLYAYALDHAAELFEFHGHNDKGERFRLQATALKAAVVRHCFNQERQLFAETPKREAYTQHTNILAVLTDAIPEHEQGPLMEKVLRDESLIQAQLYFSFYLHLAMKKVGLGDAYLAQLSRWETMINQGLSTFAETALEGRSDCHAWSAHPSYDFLATVIGIESTSPGFGSVRIRPHLGKLNAAQATMPHPQGPISVKLKRVSGGGIRASITIPAGLPGEFQWKDRTVPLYGGDNRIEL